MSKMLGKLGLLMLLTTAFCLPAFSQDSSDGPPPDFVSDGCSLFPDGNYRDCCVAHDKDYYTGGTCKERRESDNRLYRCVRSKKGWYNKLVAPIMWVGVRVLGTSFLPTPYRWGFGKKKKKMVPSKSPEDEKNKPEPQQNGGPSIEKPGEPAPLKPSGPPVEKRDNFNK